MSQRASEQQNVQASCSNGQCGEQGCGSGGGGSDELPTAPNTQAPAPGTLCMKCRKQEAELVARGREPLCHPCLHEQLLGKVRNAVRLHSLILPGDRLAVALSGGPASAALLRFLAELRNPRADRPARGKVSFTMRIIHVDESAAHALSPEAAAAWRAAVAAAAQPYIGEGVEYHCVPLEASFQEEAGSQALAGSVARLEALLAAVSDPTGREDLVRHLRSRLLLRTACTLGCARLARGDCASSLAARIVAEASKGCGHSLVGDVRLFDARHGAALPAVILPLREVSARELGLLVRHLQLPTAQPLLPANLEAAQRAAKKSINALAVAFIAGMEAHNTGSVPNILNTISKLDAFPWNEPPPPPPQPTKRRAGQQQEQQQQFLEEQQAPQHNLTGQEQRHAGGQQSQLSAVLCPICQAPLADDELPGGNSSDGDGFRHHTGSGSGAAAPSASAGCCLSCYRQVLGAAAGAQQSQVAAALPGAVQQQVAALSNACAQAAAAGAGPGVEHLRASIADFLLED